MLLKQSIGIDISKDDFKVCYSVIDNKLRVSIKGSRTFKNTTEGCQAFSEWIKKKADPNIPHHCVMEATGVYHERLAYFLKGEARVCEKTVVHIVLPNKSKNYARSLGQKSKTDKIDAQMLSQMGIERELREWIPISVNVYSLKQLVRERDRVVKCRTAAKNQLHAASYNGRPNEDVIKRSKELIELLNSQEKAILDQIKELIKQDSALSRKIKFLTSIPGVGDITAACIVSETDGFSNITSLKQLTSYAGLDIKLNESGKKKGKTTISKQGNSHIRHALFLPASTKIKHDPPTKARYERLKQRKGKGMIAHVAEHRRLLCLMYTLWKKEQMYDPDYNASKTQETAETDKLKMQEQKQAIAVQEKKRGSQAVKKIAGTKPAIQDKLK